MELEAFLSAGEVILLVASYLQLSFIDPLSYRTSLPGFHWKWLYAALQSPGPSWQAEEKGILTWSSKNVHLTYSYVPTSLPTWPGTDIITSRMLKRHSIRGKLYGKFVFYHRIFAHMSEGHPDVLDMMMSLLGHVPPPASCGREVGAVSKGPPLPCMIPVFFSPFIIVGGLATLIWTISLFIYFTLNVTNSGQMKHKL